MRQLIQRCDICSQEWSTMLVPSMDITLYSRVKQVAYADVCYDCQIKLLNNLLDKAKV